MTNQRCLKQALESLEERISRLEQENEILKKLVLELILEKLSGFYILLSWNGKSGNLFLIGREAPFVKCDKPRTNPLNTRVHTLFSIFPSPKLLIPNKNIFDTISQAVYHLTYGFSSQIFRFGRKIRPRV